MGYLILRILQTDFSITFLTSPRRGCLSPSLSWIYFHRFMKKSFLSGCSKMLRCKAPEILRSEAYLLVRRSDEG